MKSTFPTSGTTRLETAADTRAFAAELGAALEAGDVVILDGPLGAGKTTFTQGLAEGMKVKGRVTSPTFVIARVHRSLTGGPDLIHVDAYRLFGEDPDAEVDALGALDSLDLDTELDDAVIVAEWGGGLVEQLADTWLEVTFDRETAVREDPESEVRILSWRLRK
ncbi:tRNA (adenosine(37)-N6)-threonylcarbamoyltransferase complex ATPase subunit type 1 TsaE [Corynebacterium sp. P5875]|uniref:tRNA threonylcarbamoyladenosine biosynthesis protein TsaE n=1 Tax=Corynebacterium antarcticum TaxID=2800405 RepID=A0A9Q4GKJ2_9CORY|nr:tRNA (adenosine(37)-N6)-threonylcarbamoyltransferase complex ATPase subunit type 1 TsaE [Corynebacterium antarcticum]MCX7538150.1 tRNA (adenosine(37)-N6)-threonylcarbamoyltransferase complex ATPase subunit type 1 TsaE [Corynebacterium antarcticum]